jgi:hypothetical protein
MNGITRRPETHSEREKVASSASENNIRKPTKEDYDNVPQKYVSGRPLLQWCELLCVSCGMKRMHDWYMRASSVEINAFSIVVPPLTFLGRPCTIPVDFEDIWLMFRLDKLEL